MDVTVEPIANPPPGNMPQRLARTGAGLVRTLLLVLLAVVVVAASALLAVPQWRAAVLPTATVTRTAPAAWQSPQTAAPPALPLDDLDPATAPAAKALAARILKLAGAASGTPGVVLIDPATGKTLVSRADRPLLPASTMKLLTAVVALEILGNDRTFTTSVVSPRAGVVVLRGGGDPLLSDARSTGRASLQQLAVDTAAALKRQGVKKVTLGYDASLFEGAGWHRHWTDNYRYSVAPISALMVDSGFNPSTGEAQQNPAASAAKRFGERLAEQGISVAGTKAMSAAEGAAELASARSATVEQLIEHTLRFSDNVAAETLARQVGVVSDRGGSFADAEAAVRAELRTLGLWRAGMVIDDNSGLSRNNRVSPGVLATTMKLVVNEPRFRSLLLGLPVGGVSGTLEERFDDRNERAGRGVVRAKTGSLRDVSTLAGYLITADGTPLVFALLANDVVRPDQTRDWMDRTTAAWAACGC
ncbi:D-alanyl-D-alanine carboxypeptidase/D-alanyl-D-alanine-endopeptidase [Micropruina sp.]|uniref:D-alanyl-D-alanine carboxypeptidase/D-alanyl-D-alanine endopeptidase n=1 Tax=Micropruina sp. TaxID=2737536 RepID=UPI0039E4AD34